MSGRLPSRVRIVEVSPRDGLQNESRPVETAVKLELIERLVRAGLRTIEATAFVSPRWVPRMADHAEVLSGIRRRSGVAYPVLVPNMIGFDNALAAGAEEVAVFASASESFSRRNINCSIDESLDRFRPVLEAAARHGIRVRGYVSCVLGCPFEDAVVPHAVARVARELHDMGCYEISLGDTIGIGTPRQVEPMLDAVFGHVPPQHLAGHYHDTHGRALANIRVSLRMGVAVFDASVAGLGGCPYAPGAAGNVPTEDVVDLLHGLGIATGIDLDLLCGAGAFICDRLGRATRSKVALARTGTA